jgi:hypothetical protein
VILQTIRTTTTGLHPRLHAGFFCKSPRLSPKLLPSPRVRRRSTSVLRGGGGDLAPLYCLVSSRRRRARISRISPRQIYLCPRSGVFCAHSHFYFRQSWSATAGRSAMREGEIEHGWKEGPQRWVWMCVWGGELPDGEERLGRR